MGTTATKFLLHIKSYLVNVEDILEENIHPEGSDYLEPVVSYLDHGVTEISEKVEAAPLQFEPKTNQ